MVNIFGIFIFLLRWSKITKNSARNSSDSPVISTYVNEFPALRKPAGFRLLIEDFKQQYPQKEEHFMSKISLSSKDIIQFTQNKVEKYGKTSSGIEEIRFYLAILDPECEDRAESDLQRSVVAILLLPYLVGTYSKFSWG
ncbi:hypothetical protein WDU94_012265, partial [Cyamophila willieti]